MAPHIPGQPFSPADDLQLIEPSTLPRHGGYFSAVERTGGGPLLFQTPRCLSKAGIVETARGTHIDIVLDPDSEVGLWLAEVEAFAIATVAANAATWFTTPMPQDEIDYLFVSCCKRLKTKSVVRAVVREPRYAGQTGGLLVFAEDEKPLRRQDILPESPLIAVVEVRGLRYTSSSMRLELVLHQVMVLKDLAAPPPGCMIAVGPAAHAASAESPAASAESPAASAESPAASAESPAASTESSAVVEPQLEVVEPTAHADSPVLGLRSPEAVYQELYEETYRRAQAAKQRAVALFLEATEMCGAYGLEEVDAGSDDIDQLLA